MKGRKKILSAALNVTAILVSMVFILPMVVVVINSFKTQQEAYTMSLALPGQLMWENYAVVIEKGKLVTSFFNSLLYASVSVIIIVILVAMSAFVFARRKTKLNNFMYYFILIGLSIPTNYVALMQVMKWTGLLNTRAGLILIYCAINIPLSLFMCIGFINTIPREIDEAAIIDGCAPLSLFFRVIAPLLTPIMATLFVLNFMSVWNDFTMPMYFMNRTSGWPMTLAVYNFFGQFERSWNLVCADIVLTSLPVMIVFLLGQKYIVGGLTAGSVKG